MWVDYRGPLGTVYNDREISTCGWTVDSNLYNPTLRGQQKCVGLQILRMLDHQVTPTMLYYGECTSEYG